MKERPILFSGEMVRAILDGRKTQTRRVVVPQPRNPETFGISPVWGYGVHKEGAYMRGARPGLFCLHAAFDVGGRRVDRFVPCPFGKSGDRLWVRENGWEPRTPSIDDIAGGADTWPGYVYDADGISEGDREDYQVWGWKRRPSIHMPRWASRIALEITGVKVERVQEITKDGCVAEGLKLPCNERYRPVIQLSGKYAACLYPPANGDWKTATLDDYFRAYYASLWDTLNAKRGFPWSSNPFVWVLEFKRLAESPKVAAHV